MYQVITRFFLILSLLVITSCGGGDNTNNSSSMRGEPITIDDLAGVYRIVAFTITLADGTVRTERDVRSFSGTFRIDSNGFASQTISVNGLPAASLSATIAVIDNMTLRVTTATCTYNLPFELNNNRLTTFFQRGTCDSNFAETDVWERTSSQSFRTARELITSDDMDTTGLISGMIGSLLDAE